MIGKGKSISHTEASIKYGWNLEKEADFILKQNVVGNTPKEIATEFKIIQDQNEKCKRNTFSFVLSPTIEDGQKTTSRGLTKITKDFLKDLKLKEHQAVAFVHNDKEHIHVHLYVNRIDFKGKAFKDNYIGKRAQKAAERVAILNKIKTVKQVKEEKQNLNKNIRKQIYEAHRKTLLEKPNNFKEYIGKMELLSITVKPVVNKSNFLQGFRYKFKGENLKASEVHRSMSINKFSLDLKNENNSFKMRGFRLGNQLFDIVSSAEEYVNTNFKKKKNGKIRSTDRAVGR